MTGISRPSILRRACTVLVASVLLMALPMATNSDRALAAAGCTSYTVIAMRGTDEPGVLGLKLPTTIRAIVARKGSAAIRTVGVSYPASFNYLSSMNQGRASLRTQISAALSGCPSTRLMLIGYSQGAHVIGDVVVGLSAAQRNRVAGIGLIGDPMFNPALRGSVSRNGWLGGMWGKRASWPSGLYVTDVCNNADRVCASWNLVDSLAGVSRANHQNYTGLTYSPVSGRSGAAAIGYNLGGRT